MTLRKGAPTRKLTLSCSTVFMGKCKDPDKAPKIPYSGVLKKVFEVILDTNFPCNNGEVNIGRKYRIQQQLMLPRDLHLQLYKLSKDCGFGLHVAANDAIAPPIETMFLTLINVSVTDVKLNGSNIFVWVENSSSSVGNLIFYFDKDNFRLGSSLTA